MSCHPVLQWGGTRVSAPSIHSTVALARRIREMLNDAVCDTKKYTLGELSDAAHADMELCGPCSAAWIASPRGRGIEHHPSALQRRIQDVEEDLGAAIFERSAQGVRLTAAGETFIRWIRQQSVELDRARSQIESLGGLRRGHIRIACSQALVNYFLPQEIAAFRASYPHVSFAIAVVDHDAALKRLVDYEAEIALIFRPRRSAELQPIVTVGQRLHAIMAADHPLAARASLRLRDCAPIPSPSRIGPSAPAASWTRSCRRAPSRCRSSSDPIPSRCCAILRGPGRW